MENKVYRLFHREQADQTVSNIGFFANLLYQRAVAAKIEGHVPFTEKESSLGLQQRLAEGQLVTLVMYTNPSTEDPSKAIRPTIKAEPLPNRQLAVTFGIVANKDAAKTAGVKTAVQSRKIILTTQQIGEETGVTITREGTWQDPLSPTLQDEDQTHIEAVMNHLATALDSGEVAINLYLPSTT